MDNATQVEAVMNDIAILQSLGRLRKRPQRLASNNGTSRGDFEGQPLR